MVFTTRLVPYSWERHNPGACVPLGAARAPDPHEIGLIGLAATASQGIMGTALMCSVPSSWPLGFENAPHVDSPRHTGEAAHASYRLAKMPGRTRPDDRAANDDDIRGLHFDIVTGFLRLIS